MTLVVIELRKQKHTMSVLSVPEPRQREFLPEEFKVTVWSRLKPYYDELLRRDISSKTDMEQWIFNWNELDSLVQEELNWRYIRFTQNTADERATEAYHYFIQQIFPKVIKADHRLNEKLFNTTFYKQLDPAEYFIFFREARNALALYKEENVELQLEMKLHSKTYGKLMSQMMVEINGQSYTIQETGDFLQDIDRDLRELAFRNIHQRFNQNATKLDTLFNELLEMRHQIAKNAGFKNYRDFKFKELGRFDYSPEDCFRFHESIKSEIVPLLNAFYKIRQKSLKVDTLRPWDMNVNMDGKSPLKPFGSTDELIDKAIECLSEIDPYFGECLGVMKKAGNLDLDAREGKRPGGYNMPLPLSGVPFVLMNATHSVKDLIILAHESGHAIHAFYTKHHRLNSTKRSPKEVAELAAMTMEMLAMERWEVFFNDPNILKQARLQQLERVLHSLAWIALIDKFQHWIYTNPSHSNAEREQTWLELFREFQPAMVETTGLENYPERLWHRQLHIFEAPFYFIEYGFAQLGALAIWKRYRENPEDTIKKFKETLQLGNLNTIPDTYAAAGIRFDFSKEYVKSLAACLREEIEKCIFET